MAALYNTLVLTAKHLAGRVASPLSSALINVAITDNLSTLLAPLAVLLGKYGWQLRLLGLGASWMVTIISLPVLTGPLFFSLAGFGPAGPVAGSLAAWIQMTMFGGVTPAGSVFALIQSYAMGGAMGVQAVAAWQAISGAALFVGTMTTALLKFFA